MATPYTIEDTNTYTTKPARQEESSQEQGQSEETRLTLTCMYVYEQPIQQRHSLITTDNTENLDQFSKPVVRILVVGLTGHGKSSPINKIFGKDVARVEHGASACQHDKYIMKYELQYNEATLYVYDTQGMGDANISAEAIFTAVKDELKEVNLMLICHKLVNDGTKRMLQQIVSQCGKDLLNRSVLCYTKADEYKVNDNSIDIQKDSLTKNIKLILTESALTEEEFDAIPICIMSTKGLVFLRWLPFFGNAASSVQTKMPKASLPGMIGTR